jgi:hypothetical protein
MNAMKPFACGILAALSLGVPASLPALEAFPPAGHAPIIGKSWSVIGPFADAGAAESAGLEKAFSADRARDFSRRYPGGGGKWVFWTGYPDPNAKKILFQTAGRKAMGGVFFAVTYIESPSAVQTSLAFQADGGGTLWMNGAPLGELTPGVAALFPADLKRGLNEVLVKCLVEGTGAVFSAAADEGGKGLSFTGYVPGPPAAVPAAAWRVAFATPAEAAAARTALLKQGEIGLPKPAAGGVAWAWAEARAVDGGAVRIERRLPEETVFLVCHAFAPPRWRGQENRFTLFGPKGANLQVNGRRLEGAYDEASRRLAGRGPADAFRAGLNRVVVEIPPGEGEVRVGLELGHPGDMKFLAEVPPAMDPTARVGDWPSTAISNGLVTATVAIPDVEKGFYRGNRFEQAGIITRLERDGHSFFLGAAAVHEPLNPHVCCGPCEEWFEAIAYDDARPGEPFIKLGVGLYEKPFDPNPKWNYPYWPLTIFPWTTKAQKDRIEFIQEVDGPRGWGYRYVKRLVLEPGKPVLRLEHALTNTGKHRIEAEQYAHNFVALDQKPVEKGLAVAFAFPPKTAADISNLGVLEGTVFRVTADKVETRGFDVTGWGSDHRGPLLTITAPGTPAVLRIGGDFTPSKLTLFVTADQISCEPFIKVDIAPGETVSWVRLYEFIIE